MQGSAHVAAVTPDRPDPHEPPGDDRIAAMLDRGKPWDALDAAARAHGAAIERVCVALTGDPHLAAELAQDTFVVAVTALPAWRREGTLRAFLCGIARKLCARERARTGRQQARLHLVRDPAHAEADVNADAEQAFAASQRADAARKALSVLTPDDRELLVLRYEAELPYAEIGRLLAIDEPTARKRASRALLRMRQALPQEAP